MAEAKSVPKFSTIAQNEDFRSLGVTERLDIGEDYFKKHIATNPDFKALGKADKDAVVEDFFGKPYFNESGKPEVESNPMKQFAIGAINEAFLGFPIFTLERTQGGGEIIEQARQFMLDKPDTTGETVANIAGQVAGFFVGAPAKVFVKGGRATVKLAAKAFPDLIKLGRVGKTLSNTQRIARAAVEAGGGFGAYETLRAPEDSWLEKAVSVPLSATLGAAFGVAGESLKPAVSRFVSNASKGTRSVFTSELADELLTQVDRDKQKYFDLMNSRRFTAAQEFVNQNFQGKLLDQAQTEINAFSKVENLSAANKKILKKYGLKFTPELRTATEAGGLALDNADFEAVRHLARVKNKNALRQFGVSARAHMRGQGVAANIFTDKLENASVRGMVKSGQEVNQYLKFTKGLKGNELNNLVEVLEGRQAPLNNGVKTASERIRRNLTRLFGEARQLGLNLNFRENYYPHIMMSPEASGSIVRENLMAAVKRGDFNNFDEAMGVWNSYKNFIKGGSPQASTGTNARRIVNWMKNKSGGKLTDKQAENILRDYMARAKSAKYQNLEFQRAFDLPFWDVNPNRAIPEYLEGVSNRIEAVKEFGVNDQIAKNLIKEAANEGAETDLLRGVYNRMFGRQDDIGLLGIDRRTLQRIKNFEVVTKLSLAQIPNSTQSINTSFVTGIADTFRGILDTMTKEGHEFARITGSTLNTTIDDVIRRSTSGTTSFTSAFLKGTGFTGTEYINRTVAANAGKHFVNRMATRLLADNADRYAIRSLTELGISPASVIKQGGLTFQQVLEGANRVVNKTQFLSRAIDLPYFFTSPEGRVITQFKTFAFNQTKLWKDAILMEAKRGNLAPMITAVTLMPVLGEGIANLRSIATGKERGKDLDRLAENMASVGGLGIFTDMWNSARYGNLEGFLIGPFLSSVTEGAEDVYHLVHGKPKAAVKSVLNRVPFGVGRRIARDLE